MYLEKKILKPAIERNSYISYNLTVNAGNASHTLITIVQPIDMLLDKNSKK